VAAKAIACNVLADIKLRPRCLYSASFDVASAVVNVRRSAERGARASTWSGSAVLVQAPAAASIFIVAPGGTSVETMAASSAVKVAAANAVPCACIARERATAQR
jgi:hypothetical protein